MKLSENYPEIEKIFFEFMNDSISVDFIQNFIIDHIFEMEKLLTKDDYFKIITFDFNNKFSIDELKKIIENYISLVDYHTWKIKKDLNDIINRPENLMDLLLNFYKGDSGGFSFLEKFETYGSIISCYLEEPEYYSENFINEYIAKNFENIKLEAENILEDLEKGKIIISI